MDIFKVITFYSQNETLTSIEKRFRNVQSESDALEKRIALLQKQRDSIVPSKPDSLVFGWRPRGECPESASEVIANHHLALELRHRELKNLSKVFRRAHLLSTQEFRKGYLEFCKLGIERSLIERELELLIREKNSIFSELKKMEDEFYSVAEKRVVDFSHQVLNLVEKINVEEFSKNVVKSFAQLIELTMGWKWSNDGVRFLEIPGSVVTRYRDRDCVVVEKDKTLFFVGAFLIEGYLKLIVSKIEKGLKPNVRQVVNLEEDLKKL